MNNIELTIHDDNNDDGIIIIRHDLGDLQIDKKNRFMKGRVIGREGFTEQMNILYSLQNRRSRT